MKRLWIILGALALSACDLQPRIVALPDTVGDFISARYPALLADPYEQPDIYNSAASDYGVYSSPDIYGTEGNTNEYYMAGDIGDYTMPNQTVAAPVYADTDNEAKTITDEPVASDVVTPDAVPEIAPTVVPPAPEYISVPTYGGANDSEYVGPTMTVARGDTLYSISRWYATSVDVLANLNGLTPPYELRVGQVLKLPANVTTRGTDINDTINVGARPDLGQYGTVSVPVAAPSVAVETATPPAKPQPAQDKGAAASSNATNVAAATTPKAQPATSTAHTGASATREITIAAGDTLYSLSRKYEVPVNDLAVMNKLSAPFSLTVGQKLRVPDVRAASATAPKPATSTSGPAKSAASTAPAKSSGANKADTTKTSKTDTAKTDAKKTTQTAPTKTEQKKISSDPAKKLPTISARSSSKFSWPVRGKILSEYGAKSGGLFNDGINISASRGATVAAAENGVVAYAGNEVKGMGNLIIIQHSDGWMTVYAHMDSMAVRRGARVSVGQKIGTVGQTGKVDRPQLHFEIRKGTKAYNPSQYLKK